jgi:hypothetical protein
VIDPVLDRQVRRRLAVRRRVEEISGNVAMTCRYFGVANQRQPHSPISERIFKISFDESPSIHRFWRRCDPEGRRPRCVCVHASCSGPGSSTPSNDRGGRRRRGPTSIRVATVLRKLWVVTSGTPSSSRTVRHSLPKLFGSRSVPEADGNITACWPK